MRQPDNMGRGDDAASVLLSSYQAADQLLCNLHDRGFYLKAYLSLRVVIGNRYCLLSLMDSEKILFMCCCKRLIYLAAVSHLLPNAK